MMKPRKLGGREIVRGGEYVEDDRGGFRLYTGATGHPAGHHAYPLYRRRSVLVLGHGGHGKGEVCRLLAELYDAECMSSSAAALPHIFPALQSFMRLSGNTGYGSPAEAYAHRRECRDAWKELISLYNTPDKSTLSREVLSKADVYDGMRCREEFEASKHLFGHIVWVDASERVKAVDPSMSIEVQHLGDFWRIDNNGTLDDLVGRVREFGESIGLGVGRELKVTQHVSEARGECGA